MVCDHKIRFQTVNQAVTLHSASIGHTCNLKKFQLEPPMINFYLIATWSLCRTHSELTFPFSGGKYPTLSIEDLCPSAGGCYALYVTYSPWTNNLHTRTINTGLNLFMKRGWKKH